MGLARNWNIIHRMLFSVLVWNWILRLKFVEETAANSWRLVQRSDSGEPNGRTCRYENVQIRASHVSQAVGGYVCEHWRYYSLPRVNKSSRLLVWSVVLQTDFKTLFCGFTAVYCVVMKPIDANSNFLRTLVLAATYMTWLENCCITSLYCIKTI